MTEAQVFRAIAEWCDTYNTKGLYAALERIVPSSESLHATAWHRIRSYDCAQWEYDEDDHYANLEPADAVLAALWLELDAFAVTPETDQ